MAKTTMPVGKSNGANKRSADTDAFSGRSVRRRLSQGIDYGVELVTIKVEDGNSNTRTFTAHRDLLSKHSAFFRAAMNGKWKEGREGVVSLKDTSIEAFAIFHKFLYAGKIYSSKNGDFGGEIDMGPNDTSDSKEFFAYRDLELNRLASCWKLGEELLAVPFKDAITDAMIAKVLEENYSPIDMHHWIYPASSASSRIRKLLVDFAVWGWHKQTMETQAAAVKEEWSQFFVDVAVDMHKEKGNTFEGARPYEHEDTCAYHEHGDNQQCYKTMF